jgi:hypothetical protein
MEDCHDLCESSRHRSGEKGGDVDGALRWITAAQLPSQKAFALSGVAGALLQKEKK